MNSYYQSFIQLIHQEMNEGKYEQVLERIQEELSMPYIPEEVNEVLESYVLECKQHIDHPVIRPELDTLIHGSIHEQEMAVSMLKDLNLRNLHQEVQILLDSAQLLNEFKGEIIECLMEQRIDRPYKIKKDGLEITFVPSTIVNQDEDHTLAEVDAYFDQWFSIDNPTFQRFCKRLLEQEILENRPFDFTDQDALPIAKSIVRLVSEAFDQSDDFAVFVKDKQLQEIADIPLLIERRGDTYGE